MVQQQSLDRNARGVFRSKYVFKQCDPNRTRSREKVMPTEIFDAEEFVKLSEVALACRVKRLKDLVKLKLRTPSMLYTIKLQAPQAEEALKRIKCEIQEV